MSPELQSQRTTTVLPGSDAPSFPRGLAAKPLTYKVLPAVQLVPPSTLQPQNELLLSSRLYSNWCNELVEVTA